MNLFYYTPTVEEQEYSSREENIIRVRRAVQSTLVSPISYNIVRGRGQIFRHISKAALYISVYKNFHLFRLLIKSPYVH